MRSHSGFARSFVGILSLLEPEMAHDEGGDQRRAQGDYQTL